MFTLRRAVVLLVLVVGGLLAVDGGSVLLTQLSAPDDLRQAGYQAAAVVAHRHEDVPTPATAESALEAARAEAQRHHIKLDDDKFLVYANDSVDITGVATAPTLLFKRISLLEGLAEVSTTLTVEPRAMDSSGVTPGSIR